MNLPFKRYWQICLGLFLVVGSVGCSPPQEQEQDASENSYVDESSLEDVDYSESAGFDMVASLRASGWRDGTLGIVVTVDQEAAFTEQSDDSGGRRTDVTWSYKLYASQLIDVLVAPDLSIRLPETGSDEELRAAYKESPFYIDDLKELPAVTSEVTYSKRYVSLAPKSNEYISFTELADGSGYVEKLGLPSLRPSFYGNGYDMQFHMDVFLNVKNQFRGVMQGGATVAHEDEALDNDPRHISFFPVPERTIFDTYPFEQNPHLPAELADSERELALQILATLIAVDAGEQPLGPMRPGLRWHGEKNQLTLHYESPVGQELPFKGMFGARDKNIFKIDITLRANP